MGFFRWLVQRLTPGTPVPAPAATPTPTPTPPQPPPTGVVAALNAERARAGLAPLTENARLAAVATSWAQQMARTNVLTHGDFSGRMTAAIPGTAAAEDIAEGATTVAGVVALWMNSPPHRANILGPYTSAGAGSAPAAGGTVYWCVDFADR